MSLNANEKIDVIVQERNGLRSEIIVFEQGFLKCIFSFLTIAIAILGLYFDTRLFPSGKTRDFLLIGLTQVEFFIGFIALCLISNISCHAGYLEAIEQKINTLCDDTISIWESHITKRYLFHPRGSYFWSVFFVILFLLAVYGLMIVASFQSVNSILFGILFTLEVFMVSIFLIWSIIDRDKIKKYALQELNQK